MNFLLTIGNILLFLIVLSVVICIHELGHFYFAKRAGILCHEFAFGMGPRVWSKKVGETTFSIRAIPFGGFVSMAGEELEAELVKKGDKIRIGFDAHGVVDTIVLNPDDPKHQNLLEVTVETIDLKGKEMAPLFINEYAVKRDAYFHQGNKSMQVAPYERNFNSKTKTQRFLTTVAGPMMNIILAFVVLLIMAFIVGVPNYNSATIGTVSTTLPAGDYLQDGDIIRKINGVAVSAWYSTDTSMATVITELDLLGSYEYTIEIDRDGEIVTVGPIPSVFEFYGLGFVSDVDITDRLVIASPLHTNSSLLAGDEIVSINGETFNTWQEVVTYALNQTVGTDGGAISTITIRRDGELMTFSSADETYIIYGEDTLLAMGAQIVDIRIGISPSMKFSFFGSFQSATTSLVYYATMIFSTLKQLFVSEQVSVGDLSGFIGIFQMTASAAASGAKVFFSWVALLSVNLGIINLLPIPALDGGRLMFIGYEAITGKKPNQKVENVLHMIVFVLLIGLMIFITFKDILRLFA